MTVVHKHGITTLSIKTTPCFGISIFHLISTAVPYKAMQLTDIRKIITEQKNRILRENNLLLSQHFLNDDNVGKNLSCKGHPLNEDISVLITGRNEVCHSVHRGGLPQCML